MFRKNAIIHFTEDTDIFPKGTKAVVASSDVAYTSLLEIGEEEPMLIEWMTDSVMGYFTDGKIKLIGNYKLKLGQVYINHKNNTHIVPQMKTKNPYNNDVFVVYRVVNKKIKCTHRLSNQTYFITLNEFVMNCELAKD